MNTVAIVLAIVAIGVFLVASVEKLTKAWMLPLGLALISASYLLANWAPWSVHRF